MKTVSKKDLAGRLADRMEITNKEAAAMIQTLLDLVTEDLVKGDVVDFSGFGKFEVRERRGRSGINPITKEPMEIAACKSVKFSARKALKDAVRQESL